MGYRQIDGLWCPACGDRALSERRGYGLWSFRCGQCRGHWLDWPEVWRQLEARGVRRERVVFAPADCADSRHCPRCRRILAPTSVPAGRSPVVGTCAEHGMWFDHHELSEALAAAAAYAPRAAVGTLGAASLEPDWSAWRHLLELIGLARTPQ